MKRAERKLAWPIKIWRQLTNNDAMFCSNAISAQFSLGCWDILRLSFVGQVLIMANSKNCLQLKTREGKKRAKTNWWYTYQRPTKNLIEICKQQKRSYFLDWAPPVWPWKSKERSKVQTSQSLSEGDNLDDDVYKHRKNFECYPGHSLGVNQ